MQRRSGRGGRNPPSPPSTQVLARVQITERWELEERYECLEIWLKEDLPEEKMFRACPLTLLSLLAIDDARGQMVSSESDEE
jgi:hypothetical protein